MPSQAFYVRFSVPPELVGATLESLRLVRASGKLRKGVNEVIKAIERGQARFVVVAEDVDPPEIVAFLPSLCEEKKIPYTYVPKKEELGQAAGLSVPASSVAVIDPGEAKGYIDEIVKRLAEIKR